MTPIELLHQEFSNVRLALAETLRHDYGPELSIEYHKECENRLEEIKKALPNISSTDIRTISAHLNRLSRLASWISLIERSHLGEFSWPFAFELRRMATTLFAETDMKDDRLDPICHIISEGQDYQIVYESTVSVAGGRQRFLVVAFPRSLKHHVLLHTIFGHELGHTALDAGATSSTMGANVVAALMDHGPMENESTATTWLNDPQAPSEISAALSDYSARTGRGYTFSETSRDMWLFELICDLFGLLLFGPGFLAAHRALLRPMQPSAFQIDLAESTHPPYAVRHKMLVQAMHLLGWQTPVIQSNHGVYHQAENELLGYILDDTYPSWALLFDNGQLSRAITGIQSIFAPHHNLNYKRPDNEEILLKLVKRLNKRLPPILADIDIDGTPRLTKVEISQMLYAGWVFWAGRVHLQTTSDLDFLVINKLCNHALLQQCAINEAIDSGTV